MLTLQSTAEEAIAFIKAHDADARTLTSKNTAELERIDREELAGTGSFRVFGKLSKHELITDILDVRYPREQLDLARHIRWQAAGIECSDACRHHGHRDHGTATGPDGTVHSLIGPNLTSCGRDALAWSKALAVAQMAGAVIFCGACEHPQTFAEHAASSVAAIAEASR